MNSIVLLPLCRLSEPLARSTLLKLVRVKLSPSGEVPDAPRLLRLDHRPERLDALGASDVGHHRGADRESGDDDRSPPGVTRMCRLPDLRARRDRRAILGPPPRASLSDFGPSGPGAETLALRV
jgi:hypothetical protein